MGLVITLHPKFAIFCLTCLVTLCIFLFVQIAERHQSNLLIDTDYTDTKSVYDLSLGKLDHWCLTGDDDSCDCEDPLEPVSRGENKQWVKAHKTNNEAVFNIVANKDMIDVVFLGETIVETWNGKKIGRNSTKLQNTKLSFEEHFDESQGGSWNGLALGIQGDTVSQSFFYGWNLFFSFLSSPSMSSSPSSSSSSSPLSPLSFFYVSFLFILHSHPMFSGGFYMEKWIKILTQLFGGSLLEPMTWRYNNVRRRLYYWASFV